MFTGIITHNGRLEKKEGQVFRFFAPDALIQKLKKGDSIAVNGCCLTVTNILGSTFSVEIMPETEKRTTLGLLKKEDVVNFELPATLNSFLSGHIVQGHVDGVGKVISYKLQVTSLILEIGVAKSLAKYIVSKGSIAVNGISLTVIEAGEDFFCVGIIPYTLENTMLKEIKTGDLVNIEVDILGKYVEKILKPASTQRGERVQDDIKI